MKIYDSDLRNELTDPDLTKGILEVTRRLVTHHPEQERKTHLEVMDGTVTALCPNGLRHEVVDQEYAAAWDEYETVQRYVPYSAERLAEMEAAAKAQQEADELMAKAQNEQAEKLARIDAIDAQVTYTAMMTDTLMETDNV